jgi:hypothetical protein
MLTACRALRGFLGLPPMLGRAARLLEILTWPLLTSCLTSR